MEKKTMGAFIAVLRKSNGMTQKDLAEKLGVSDKTVSHWERDESAPDLTLIPVIAEIFGVTCDELLRGEKAMKNTPEEPSGKTEKQIKHLLNRSSAKFKTRSMISLGLSAAGLLAALLCNFGFTHAYLGFFIGCIFWTAAVICESVFSSHAFYAVSLDEFEGTDINDYRISAVRLTEKVICAPAVMLGFSLPLVIIPYDAFQGLTAGTWLLWGFLTAAVMAAVWLIIVQAVNNALIRKGVYALTKSADIIRHNTDKLKVRCTAVVAAIILVLMIGQAAFNSYAGPEAFTAGTSFANIDDFKKYMETEKEGEYYVGTIAQRVPEAAQGYFDSEGNPDVTLQQASGDTPQYFDVDGNPVTKEQALAECILDNNGNVVCEYVHLNQEVVMTRYSGAGTDKFTVTAYTSEQLMQGAAARDFINTRWVALYIIAIGIGFIVYLRKRAKLIRSTLKG